MGAEAEEPETVTAAFFEPTDEGFAPREHARSPWSPDMLHGRLLGGLAAAAIERDHGRDDLQPARLTMDLFKAAPMKPLQVTTTLVRDGGRIRVADAALTCDGAEVGRASVIFLRRGEQPAATVWAPPEWDVPHPDDIEPPPPNPMRRMNAMEMRPVAGAGMGTPGQKRVWIRDRCELVEGTRSSPFARVGAMADFASPLGNSGDSGLQFINADFTLYLRRSPVGEWIGLEVGSHLSEAGIAITHSTLYDTDGAIGYSDVCAVANARAPIP